LKENFRRVRLPQDEKRRGEEEECSIFTQGQGRGPDCLESENTGESSASKAEKDLNPVKTQEKGSVLHTAQELGLGGSTRGPRKDSPEKRKGEYL